MDDKIFKAYDIRGIYPDQIDEVAVFRIARAYARVIKPKKVALGRDVRVSSESLWQSACQGLRAEGVEVFDIGKVSTDMMYFAVAFHKLDGGITVTASHNPKEYNGMKMVREKAIPISFETGIEAMRDMAKIIDESPGGETYKAEQLDIWQDYIDHCLGFIKNHQIKPFKIVANANFGLAGKVFEQMVERADFPIEIVPLNFEPDGTFPKGRPDPFIPENRHETSELVKSSGADFAVAWDADADRCFFFDEQGDFIDGYFIVALLSEIILRGHRGEKVIIDPRLAFATRQAVKESGGIPIVNRVGHTYIKQRMRKENAIFAGENSAHLYFRENYFCDNGMIPLLMILAELSGTGKRLSELVANWRTKVFVSDETNFKVQDTSEVISEMKAKYQDGEQDETDGLSVEYADRRFNVRASNTEPLIRLNVESYDRKLTEAFTKELSDFIKKFE